MNSTKKKPGRKPKPYVCPWDGKTINGLYACPDGRWRVTETGEKFTEADPRLAVLRFRRWEARARGDEALIQLPGPLHEDVEADGAIAAVLRHELGVGEHRAGADGTLVLNIPDASGSLTLHRGLPATAIWTHVREEILRRPQFVAQMTGIEQIGYLTDLRKPKPSPSLDDLSSLFFQKKKDMSGDWRSKCRSFWKEFCEVTNGANVREITQEMVTTYKDAVFDRQKEGDQDHPDGFGPTYVRQRFEAIKSMINFPPKHRGQWPDDCNRLYGYCKVLGKPQRNRPKPHPTSRDHFNRLLLAADDDRLAAGLLACLNLCMYVGEAVRLDWADVDLDSGEVVGDRAKLGRVIRIGMLWPQTVAALRRIKRANLGPIFVNDAGNQMTYIDFKRLFNKARESAGLSDCQPRVPQTSDIRDAAYTAAIRAKVGMTVVKMLAGHETGISDQYVLRDPTMVAEACTAVRRVYAD